MNVDNTQVKQRLIFFIALIIGGLILAALSSMLPLWIYGLDMAGIKSNPDHIKSAPAGFFRLSLLFSHLTMFILPSIIYGIYVFKKDFFKGFLWNKSIDAKLLFAIAFLIAAYPLVGFAHEINSWIPLTEGMRSDESRIADIIQKIILDGGHFTLFLNVLLIAVMPAIGEELVFRGILQQNLEKLMRNPHIAIWISSLLFSAIHFQFEGFLARTVLGAILGYSYYLTRNFWIPVLLHFFNNLLPLIALRVFNHDMTNQIEQAQVGFNYWTLLLPIIFLPLLYFFYLRIYGTEENINT